MRTELVLRATRVVVGAALAAGCTGPSSFVGEIEGTDAVVGVVLEGGVGRMYACGGPASQADYHHWYELEADGEGWSGAVGAREVVLEPAAGGGFSGFLTVDGEPAGTLALSPGGADEGPWIPESDVGDEGCLAGAVVFDGGSGLQGVYYCLDELVPGKATFTAQVVPVGAVDPSSGRIPVRVADEADLEFAIVPASP